MTDNDLFFEEQFKIRASEVDFDRKASLPAICNLLQEVAGNHAYELKFDITDLQRSQLTWVLHRLRVVIDRYPRWRETITIRTWPSGSDGLRAHRDFLMVDTDDNIIGKSLSHWLILDMENRRPTRIPKEILEYAPEGIDHVLPKTGAEFPELKEADNTQKFEVRNTDLDLNAHVNNVRYIEWALSCLSSPSKINSIDIKFMGEALSGDTVVASTKEMSSKENRFSLFRTSDQKMLARGKTEH